MPTRVTTGPQGGARSLLIAVVALMALAAGGFAAIGVGVGGQTGASSPEAAGEKLFEALSDEDLIGVLEVIDPAERDVILPFVEELESDLSRLGLTSDVDLGDLPGFDLEVEDLQLATQELAPGVVEVGVVGGALRSRTEPESVPIGDVLRDLVEATGGELDIQAAESESALGGGEFFIATESDGRWHLSLFFTVAEYARRDAGEPPPDFAGGVVAQGASSPERAVTEFVEAATALDLERMIALLPPDEARALQVYAPLFLDDAQASLDELQIEEGFDVTVEGLEYETRDVDGGTRVVPVAGDVTIATEEGGLSMSLTDMCLEATGELAEDLEADFGDARVCPDHIEEAADLDEQTQAELRELGALFEDFEAGIVVVERDGAYYIDPLRTFTDVVAQVFDGIEREDLEEGGILYRLITGELSAFDVDLDEDLEFEEDFGYDDDLDVDVSDEGCDDFGDTATTADDC